METPHDSVLIHHYVPQQNQAIYGKGGEELSFKLDSVPQIAGFSPS